MKTPITMATTLLAAGVSMAQVVNFDKDNTGVPPVGWTCDGQRPPAMDGRTRSQRTQRAERSDAVGCGRFPVVRSNGH